jgi:hypothetical protein
MVHDQQEDFIDAVHESSLSPEQKAGWERECLWEAVNEYTASCGGDTSNTTISPRRMAAVAAVEKIFDGIRRAAQGKSPMPEETHVLLAEGERVRFVRYLQQDAQSNRLLAGQLDRISVPALARKKRELALAQETVAQDILSFEAQTIK